MARAGLSKHVGGLMGTVDVVVVVAVVHHTSLVAVRAGPSKHMGRLMGRTERPIESPHLMGRGPARPTKFREDGPRPGPAHQILRGWAAARPGPSNFQKSRPGPAHDKPWFPVRAGSTDRRNLPSSNFCILVFSS